MIIYILNSEHGSYPGHNLRLSEKQLMWTIQNNTTKNIKLHW
jgi:hypothetical protein